MQILTMKIINPYSYIFFQIWYFLKRNDLLKNFRFSFTRNILSFFETLNFLTVICMITQNELIRKISVSSLLGFLILNQLLYKGYDYELAKEKYSSKSKSMHVIIVIGIIAYFIISFILLFVFLN